MNLSRDVLKWLQGLDLSFPVKNVKRDFSNGYTVAEILACYYPNDIQMHSFDNGTSLPKKLDNWDQIERFFRKRDIQLDHEAVMDTIHCRETGAVDIIEVVYQFLTNKKASKMPPSQATTEVTLPAFARPTASQLIKDNLLNSELATIKDPSIAAKKAELIIKTHKEASKLHKKNKNPFFKGTAPTSPTPEKGTRPNTFTPDNIEDSKLGNDGIIGGNGMRLSDLAISSPIPKINATSNNNNNNAVNQVREQPPRVSRMVTSTPFEKDAIPVQFKDISIKSISPITPTPPFTISNNNNSNNNLSSGVNYGASNETLSLNVTPLQRPSPLGNLNASSNSGNSNENNFIQIPPLRSLPPLINHASSSLLNEEKNSSSLNFPDTINSTSQSVSVVSQIVSRQLTNSEILKSFMPNISLAEQFFSSLSRVPSDLFVSVVKDIEQNALDILSTTFLGNGGGKELASFTELILPCIANLSFKKYPTEVENDYLVFERVYSLFSSFGDKMASNSTTPSTSLPFSWKLFAQHVLPIMISHLTSSPYKFRHIIPVSLRFGGSNNPFTIIALSEKLKELITDSVVYSLTMATVTSKFMESTSNPILNTSTLEKLFSESTWMSFGDKVPSSLKISNNNPSSQKNNESNLNPITQTSGLSILNEICLFNIPSSIELIELISMNTNNKWWEIDAQIIMCVTKLWYSLIKDTSSASYQERLLAIITNIFSVKSPKSLSFSLVASISLSKCSGNSYLCKLFIDSLSNLQPKIVNSLLNDEKWCVNDKTGFGGMWVFLQTYGESATNYNQSLQPITSVWNSLMVIDECTRCVIEIERTQKKVPVSYLVIIEAAFRSLSTNVRQEEKSRLSNFFHTRGYAGSEKRNLTNPTGGSNLVELLYLCLCYEEQSSYASSILLQYMKLFSQESLSTFPLLLSTTLLIYPANNTGNQACQNSLFNLISKIWEFGGPFSDSVVNLFRNFPEHVRKTKLGAILPS